MSVTGKQYTVTVNGTFFWELLLDYDNSTNSSEIRSQYSTKTVEKFSNSTFTESVHNEIEKNANSVSVGLSVGASYEFVDTSVDTTVSSSREVENFFGTIVRSQKDYSYEKVDEKSHDFKVGPYSKLSIYQLYFSAPGVRYACDATVTGGERTADVVAPIKVVVKEREYISILHVVYGDNELQKPGDCLKEINGLSPDINKGFGGKYVWFIPVWTTQVDKAAINLNVVTQKSENKQFLDFARGAGGQYRYLIADKDPRVPDKTYEAALLRSSKEVKTVPDGFTRMTRDLNDGRGGEFLYVVYKTMKAYPISAL